LYPGHEMPIVYEHLGEKPDNAVSRELRKAK